MVTLFVLGDEACGGVHINKGHPAAAAAALDNPLHTSGKLPHTHGQPFHVMPTFPAPPPLENLTITTIPEVVTPFHLLQPFWKTSPPSL